MKTSIRAFQETDVPNKVRWINDDRNNQFLHYDLPLNLESTYSWYRRNQHLTDRYDAVIEYEGKSVGIIGLLSIKDRRAEYYITLGEHEYKGKGIAKEATRQLLDYGFGELGLDEVYLYTEVDNIGAQKLFEKCGFHQKGLLKESAVNRGVAVDRFYYAITAEEFMKINSITHIVFVGGGTAP